jgi:hypothetical protein
MYIAQPSNLPTKPKTNWGSIFQLVLSALAAITLLGCAVLIVSSTAINYFIQDPAATDPTMSFMVAGSLAFAGFLTLPSAWYAWKHLSHPDIEPAPRKEPRNFVPILTVVVVVLVTAALFLGNWVSTNDKISWLILPLLNIVATGLPAFWLVYVGTRGLIPGRPSRWWGVFSSGLVFTPVIILVVELFVLIAVGILAFIWVMFDPSLSDQLTSLASRLQEAGANPEALLQIVLPFMLNPGVLILVFAFISVIVPVVEEALKPLGLWFLAGQRITPAQGFGYGVLCGAGFGLFENLGNTSGGGETWAILTATRASTLLLHCFNSGLVGWALASVWTQRRYLRLAVTFLYVVIIHGLWNGLAVLSLMGSLEGETSVSIPASLVQMGSYAPIGIVALAAFNLVFYLGFNSSLRKSLPNPPTISSESAPESPDTISPLSPQIDEDFPSETNP